MSSNTVARIPARRRDRIFAEIKRIVGEAEAIDRALEPLGEAVAQDEALEEIADLLGAEVRRTRERSRRVKATAA